MNNNNHKQGCMINMRCLVYHADGICPGPYGQCTCSSLQETPNKGYKCIDTLKQLQEKVEFTNEGIFEKSIVTIDANTNILSVNLNEYIKQIEVSAYNAGKAEMLDTVLKEIDTMIVHRPDELIKLNKDLPSTLQEQSYLQAIGYCEALDTLKNKLLDSK